VTGLSSGVAAISAGNDFTCALLTNGGVRCWGDNSEGQLGNGTLTNSSSPVVVSGLSSSAVSIATGSRHACALLTSGTVQCWGANSSLELGNGNPVGRSMTPVDVQFLGAGVKSVAVGGSHSCALFNAGNVKCWGSNSYGQTGSDFLHWRTGVADVGNLNSSAISIDLGNSHSCAVLSTGEARCWGLNNHSQLGNGGTTNTHLPVTVSGLSSGVTSISAGVSYSCATISDGGVKCWGINSWGTLGDGTTTTRSTPVSVNGLF
jgi:alpha-tubulin suppressor-like RCC1 family protein